VSVYRPNIVVAVTFFVVNVLVCGAVAVCVALVCA
jgi:hypothetical protein